MFAVMLLVLAAAGVWALAAVAVALLAGGVIHARDHHDVPVGGPSSGCRLAVRAPVVR